MKTKTIAVLASFSLLSAAGLRSEPWNSTNPATEDARAGAAAVSPRAAGPANGAGGVAAPNEEMRQRFQKAREAVKGDPEVVAARAKIPMAKSLEEREQAVREFKQIMMRACLRVDPGLKDVFQAMRASHPPKTPEAVSPQ